MHSTKRALPRLFAVVCVMICAPGRWWKYHVGLVQRAAYGDQITGKSAASFRLVGG
jgi:hypothetical protein